MVRLRVDIKLRLYFNQLPVKMQKRSFHVLLINKTRLNSTMNSTSLFHYEFLITSLFVFFFHLMISDF